MENLSVISRNPSVVYIGTENIDEDRIDGEFYNYKYLENEIKLKKSGVKIKVLNDVIERMNSPIGWQGIPSTSYLPHGLGVPLIRVQNVSDLILDEESLIGVEESIYDEQPAIQAQANDIIITRVGTIGRVCRIPEKINRIAMGQNLTRIKLKETLVESGFMLAYMSSKFCQIQMERYAYGGVQASLTNRNIKQLLVPIPSPEIQKYIGDKVRKAEELREEAKRLIKEAEEILYSQLKQEQYLEKQKSIVNKYIWLSDKEVDTRIDSQYYKPNYILYKHILNKNGIKTKKIKDVVKDIRTGTTPQSNYITKDEKRIKFLRVNNLGYCMLEKDDMLYVNDKYDEKKLKIIPKGDILVSIAGTLGRSSVVDMDNCTTNQNIAALTLKNINFIKPYYLSLYLNSYFGYLSLDTISTQATVKYINNELLGEIEIPLIDIDIQLIIEEKIAKYKNKINKSKQLIQEAKQDVEDLIEGNFDMSKVKANS